MAGALIRLYTGFEALFTICSLLSSVMMLQEHPKVKWGGDIGQLLQRPKILMTTAQRLLGAPRRSACHVCSACCRHPVKPLLPFTEQLLGKIARA